MTKVRANCFLQGMSTVLISSGATPVRQAVPASPTLVPPTVLVEATLVRLALAAGSVQATAARFREPEVKSLRTLAKCCLNCVLLFWPWDFKKSVRKLLGILCVMPCNALWSMNLTASVRVWFHI